MSKTVRTNSFFVPWLCCCLIALGAKSPLMAQSAGNAPAAQVLITQPINSSRLYTLAGNTRGEANARNGNRP